MGEYVRPSNQVNFYQPTENDTCMQYSTKEKQVLPCSTLANPYTAPILENLFEKVCEVLTCSNKKSPMSKLGWHRFPWKKKELQRWIRLCGLHYNPGQQGYICSIHFAPSAFIDTSSYTLKNEVYPSLFLPMPSDFRFAFKSSKDDHFYCIPKEITWQERKSATYIRVNPNTNTENKDKSMNKSHTNINLNDPFEVGEIRPIPNMRLEASSPSRPTLLNRKPPLKGKGTENIPMKQTNSHVYNVSYQHEKSIDHADGSMVGSIELVQPKVGQVKEPCQLKPDDVVPEIIPIKQTNSHVYNVSYQHEKSTDHVDDSLVGTIELVEPKVGQVEKPCQLKPDDLVGETKAMMSTNSNVCNVPYQHVKLTDHVNDSLVGLEFVEPTVVQVKDRSQLKPDDKVILRKKPLKEVVPMTRMNTQINQSINDKEDFKPPKGRKKTVGTIELVDPKLGQVFEVKVNEPSHLRPDDRKKLTQLAARPVIIKKKKSHINREKKWITFPLRVATTFKFNVNKRIDLKSDDFESDYLMIIANITRCCMCLGLQEDNKMVSIITEYKCNDFGRILSILSTLCGSEIVSPYCCSKCADKVLDCFNTLLEINLAMSSACKKWSTLPQKLSPSQPMCNLCQTEYKSQQQLLDHVMLHVVEPLPFSQMVDPLLKSEVVKVDAEEGELVPVGAEQEQTRQDEHNYNSHTKQTKKTAPGNDWIVCHICGKKRRRSAMKEHLGYHAYGERAIGSSRCNICHLWFNDRIELHNHRNEVHNIDDVNTKKLKKCRFCDLKFSTFRTRHAHEDAAHDVDCYHYCPVCSKKFHFIESVISHCRSKHPGCIQNIKKDKKVSQTKTNTNRRKKSEKNEEGSPALSFEEVPNVLQIPIESYCQEEIVATHTLKINDNFEVQHKKRRQRKKKLPKPSIPTDVHYLQSDRNETLNNSLVKQISIVEKSSESLSYVVGKQINQNTGVEYFQKSTKKRKSYETPTDVHDLPEYHYKNLENRSITEMAATKLTDNLFDAVDHSKQINQNAGVQYFQKNTKKRKSYEYCYKNLEDGSIEQMALCKSKSSAKKIQTKMNEEEGRALLPLHEPCIKTPVQNVFHRNELKKGIISEGNNARKVDKIHYANNFESKMSLQRHETQIAVWNIIGCYEEMVTAAP